MNKIFDFQVVDPRGTKLTQHKDVELAPEACYFYALRLKQRFGMRTITIRWKEKGSKDWIILDSN
jgi:hypothetical protein